MCTSFTCIAEILHSYIVKEHNLNYIILMTILPIVEAYSATVMPAS